MIKGIKDEWGKHQHKDSTERANSSEYRTTNWIGRNTRKRMFLDGTEEFEMCTVEGTAVSMGVKMINEECVKAEWRHV